MKILFASGFTHFPQRFGGVQSNTHELALELKRLGHEPIVAAALSAGGYIGLRTRLLGKIVDGRRLHDRVMGYPTYRRWNVTDALPELVAATRPDVAVVQPDNPIGLAKRLDALGVPQIVYLHDVEWDAIGGDPRDLRHARFVANSEFTAERFRRDFGLDSTVVRPLFRAADYRAAGKGDSVTFINPHPLKGVEIAMQLVALCPDIPFRFVRSWTLPAERETALAAFAARHPNLTLERSTRRMDRIYGHAKIVLMPSMWEEAWGRVASEAHFSGVPLLASRRGGLPESVGPGGLLVDPDAPIDAWVAALRRLWDDKAFYAATSDAALAYSRRPQLDPAHQIETLIEAAQRAIAAKPRAMG